MNKTKTLILALLAMASTAFATKPTTTDEGMWLPILIGKNQAQMKKQGYKLTAKDIYDINKASLKDAIVMLGDGFCTGEIVSNKGLLFTNHHCGYDAITTLSTPQDNILDNGFWAKTNAEERPVKDFSVDILVRMEDVTNKILPELKGLDEKARAAKVNSLGNEFSKKAIDGTTYNASVREFAKGNVYYLFVFETFTDIRLVGTPPQSIGKFGGDTDNWEWPRHTGDFSVFRIYVNKENKPADYAKDNVPYTPKKFLPVSLKGVKAGDFAMVFGFPGRTNRYETSMGVKLAIEKVNPAIINSRDIRLKAWKEEMDKDVATKLALSSEYASIANYWKYFIGQTQQMQRLKVYDQKLALEAQFKDFAKGKPEYEGIFDEWQKAYTAYEPYAAHQSYLSQGIFGANVVQMALGAGALEPMLSDTAKNKNAIAQMRNGFLKNADEFYKGFNLPSDQKIVAQTLLLFYNNVPKDQHPPVVAEILKEFSAGTPEESFKKFAQEMYFTSHFASKANLVKFLNNPTADGLTNDLAYRYFNGFRKNYVSKFSKFAADFQSADKRLARAYIKGLGEMNPDLVKYPDANSTLRVSYGNVQTYAPRDAVHYDHQTTMKGLAEKYKPGDSEFDLPKNFFDLYNAKDFGQYADKDGQVPVAFITNNDITGGNSGSPVLNAKGELIGLAFDGNWEAMSGDIVFDKTYKRCINVDIRYVLWCIEKLGGSDLVKELQIVK
ncbi:MAG: S46 family peptidase [Runella slithyformis]|nr:MAG: S46 family peptidase [Runella slithyformis]TAE97184.1 MAG: S46 family peptidase [Runella slithyformis]TAF29638.1 MAG: S46 family peptidase [Runella slithyformis]TAF48443.1 MAG: S46 family peptidase [Runella slithyformis]TAF83042.1 MAG: S46 family peptidase [Runella slithyformis]